MTQSTRPFEKRDIPATLGGLLLGAFFGIILASLVFLMVDGFWKLFILLLPVFLLQLAFEAGILGIFKMFRRGWYRFRNIPYPPARPPEPAPVPLPVLRQKSLETGFACGILVAMFSRFLL